MRIICPNCDAQYEVPNTVIPTDGRDVECSNCGKTWFQHHPDYPPQVDEDDPDSVLVVHPAPPPSEPEDDAQQPKRRELDPKTEDILRSEAQRETAARAAETLEVQTDLNLPEGDDDANRRARDAQARMAQLRGDEATETSNDATETLDPKEKAAIAAASVGAVASRRELLPDIEEINSTLRSAGDRDEGITSAQASAPGDAPKKGGFRRGFSFALLLVAVCVLLYVFAPQIAEAVPQADPWISSYVTTVDALRLWLDGKVETAAKWLDATAAASGQ